MAKNKISSQIEPLIQKIEQLDKVQRLLICVGTIAGLAVLYYFLMAKPVMEKTQSYKKQFKSTTNQLSIAKKKAAELPELRKQKEMKKAEFMKAMKALPEKEELPALLTSISQKGQESEVLFSSFTPGKESIQGFYAEIPISLKMKGRFHNIIGFFDRVSRMNRIVNIRDISLKVDKKDGLSADCQAVTFKFVDQNKKGK